MGLILTPDHHSVASADKAKEICNPFFERTGVTAFVYARIFDHGVTYGLNTNAQWQLHHFNSGHLVTPSVSEDIINKKFSFILSTQTTPALFLRTMEDFRLILGMDYPYFSIERYAGYYDLYVFCTAVDRAELINFYLNHSAYIEKFKQYFINKAKNLIKEASQHKIIIPLSMRPHIDWSVPGKDYTGLDPSGYIFHYQNQEIGLTAKEIKCLTCFYRGHSIKSAAKAMGISPRTVEFHLNNLKAKLHVTTKVEMLTVLNSLNPQIFAFLT